MGLLTLKFTATHRCTLQDCVIFQSKFDGSAQDPLADLCVIVFRSIDVAISMHTTFSINHSSALYWKHEFDLPERFSIQGVSYNRDN